MNLLQTLEAEQMNAVRAKPLPDFRAGDTVKVNVKVVEVSYDEKAKAEKEVQGEGDVRLHKRSLMETSPEASSKPNVRAIAARRTHSM